MSTRVVALFVALSITSFAGPVALADERDGLKLSVAVVGDRPLPHHAVRLRVEVENVGQKPIAGLLALENTIRVVGVTKDDREVRPAGFIDLLVDIRKRGPGDGIFPNRSMPVTLAAGERRAVTFPIGVRRTENSVEPLFPEPGKYVVRCQYVYTTRTPRDAPPEGAAGEEVSLFANVTVEVGEPDKKDEAWTKALARDAGLAATILQPHEGCTSARAAVVRDLIAKAPESAYVNYGRLTVARFHLIGDADPKASQRVNYAMAADILEPAISRLDYTGFPFHPHVYLNLAQAAPEYATRTRLVLGQDHRTSLEWIEVVGEKMPTEEWQRFRKEPAKDVGGKP